MLQVKGLDRKFKIRQVTDESVTTCVRPYKERDRVKAIEKHLRHDLPKILNKLKIGEEHGSDYEDEYDTEEEEVPEE